MVIPPDYVITHKKEDSTQVRVEFRSNITLKKANGYIAWPTEGGPRPFLTSTQLMHAIRLIEKDPKAPPMTKALRPVIPEDPFNRVLSLCLLEDGKTQFVRLKSDNIHTDDVDYQRAWRLIVDTGFKDYFVLPYNRKLTDSYWKDEVSKDWKKANKLLGI